MKVDLHVHTEYSGDSLTTLPEVIGWARRRGLGALAITDHNTIAGALVARQSSPLPIIVGEEIRTSEGEIIGLFLDREIPPGLSPLETVRCIRQQGGLVYVPHPTDRLRHSAIGRTALAEIVEQVDLIEVLNARVTFPIDNQQAATFARVHGLPCGAGSDAHQRFEIGQAYVEMGPFHDAASFMASIACGSVCGHISSLLVHVGSTYARVAKTFMLNASSRR